MEISGKVPPIKIDAYLNNAKKNNKIEGSFKQDAGAVSKGDKVELSQTANEVKKARAQLDAIPDIREEKVGELKDQIHGGTYKIDGKKIAFNILRESLIDEIV